MWSRNQYTVCLDISTCANAFQRLTLHVGSVSLHIFSGYTHARRLTSGLSTSASRGLVQASDRQAHPCLSCQELP